MEGDMGYEDALEKAWDCRDIQPAVNMGRGWPKPEVFQLRLMLIFNLVCIGVFRVLLCTTRLRKSPKHANLPSLSPSTILYTPPALAQPRH